MFEVVILQLFVADIFVRFGNIMFLRLIGIPMATKSAALIADLFYTAICTHCLDYSTIIANTWTIS
jgi:hypothetical protein